ncbi:HAD family hydrolase [Streptomyces sp. NPDC002889]|uniref:HAD family hydrolase n=1 Tax=Streptomyces sp. NPDC002889 TaxID=3364669 RepID=UPI00369A8433
MTYPNVTSLRDLIAPAKCVLFDFDGPVCRLFHGHPAADVAAALRARGRQRVDLFDRAVRMDDTSAGDPHALLTAADLAFPGSELVPELERLLTAEELRATRTALPTEGADRLIARLSAAGVHLAITTNNSAAAALRYLQRAGLAQYFGDHIHGRLPDPRLLKPNPHCLSRALEVSGFTAGESLMIGDSPADYEAASKLGVRFLGYARNEAKRRHLWEAGARLYVPSFAPLLEAVERGLRME